MKSKLLFAAIFISTLTLMSLGVHATTYINETFEDDTIGTAPTNTVQKNVAQVTTQAGSGVIGTDNVARFNDTSASLNGNLEYNVGTSNTVGNLYIQFDLLNNAPGSSGSATNPIIFGVAPWSNASGISLGANANRDFGIEIFQAGASSTLKIRTNALAFVNTTYTMSALLTFKIWVNDDDSATLAYTRPDNSAAATLGVNSFVVWINDALVATETDSGFGMNPLLTTNRNTSLGRFGFSSTTTTVTDFSIDNLLVTDVTAVPEPSSVALVLGGGILLGWYSQRRIARR